MTISSPISVFRQRGPRPHAAGVRLRVCEAACLLVFATAGFATPVKELFDCSRRNDVGGMAVLVESHGTRLLKRADGHGITALHIAAALNHADTVAYLVANDAAVDAATTGGFTPLHWACSRDAVDAARILVRNQAAVNAVTPAGITPLHWAGGNNATNSVKLLIAAGADVAATTEQGLNALHWAMMGGATEAAFILAYQIVEKDLDGPSPDSGAALAEARAVKQESTRMPPKPPRHPETPDLSPRPLPGSDIWIPLGPDVGITFAWLEPLGLWMSRTEITNDQYRRFDPDHDSLFRETFSLNEPNQPAVHVSWTDAAAFCRWINERYDYRLPRNSRCRLPTYTEWTNAASCGDQRRYAWGNEWPPAYGNFSDETARKFLPDWSGIVGYTDGHVVTCDVMESGTNRWGLFGMAGNVWEWCADWHDDTRTYRIRAGGSWDFDTEPTLRLAHRGFDRPEAAYDTIGFRVVIAPSATNGVPSGITP